MYTIRTTNNHRYEVLRNGKPVHLPEAFQTQAEAEIAIDALEAQDALVQADSNERAPYNTLYATILALPELREMRRAIQEAYGEAAHKSKLASASMRAGTRAEGTVSCMGRDVGAIRISRGDDMADEADELWAYHRKLSRDHEDALLAKMDEMGCPLWMRCGRGRPVGSGDDRVITKRLRLTPAENIALDQLVADSGMTFSQYARNKLFETK